MTAMGSIWSIIGQTRALTQLQRVLGSERLASTWIFHGPMGVGKYRTALAFAKCGLCPAPSRRPNAGEHVLPALPGDFQLIEPCGECPSCRACDAQLHPDLHVINRQLGSVYDRGGKSRRTTLGIDIIRGEMIGDDSPDHRVESKLYKHSQMGRGKWFIIDEADLMQPVAQNALLKALEEPPPRTYIVMCTGSVGDLLSTIRSRSQQVAFEPLPADVIIRRLMEDGVSATDAGLLARLSENSLGRIMSWLPAAPATATGKKSAKPATDGNILRVAHRVAQAMDHLLMGQAGAGDLAQVVNDGAAMMAEVFLSHDPTASKDRSTRDGGMVTFALIEMWLCDRLRSAVGRPVEFTLPSTAGAMDLDRARACMEICSQAAAQLDANVHQPTAVMNACTAMEAVIRGVA